MTASLVAPGHRRGAGLTRPEPVIFDCDGVLVDSEGIAARVEAACLTEAGLPVSAEEIVREFTGIAAPTCHGILEARFGATLPGDFGAVLRARTLAAFDAELRAVPGVSDAPAALSDLPRCVASSSDHDRIVHSLRLAGLSEWFLPHVFSATEVPFGKPAPDLFLHAAARRGAPPHRCVVVEDSVAGVRAAVSAGMPVVGFTGASHCRPDHAGALRAAGASAVIAEMRALPTLLADARPRGAGRLTATSSVRETRSHPGAPPTTLTPDGSR